MDPNSVGMGDDLDETAKMLQEQEEMFLDDNDDGEDREEDLHFLPPDHPLMERAQKALKEQLERNHNRVSLKLAEKEEEVSRMRKTREDVGVELYGLQQQLAKLQMTLERLYEKYNGNHASRTEVEAALEELKQQFEDAVDEENAIKKKFRTGQKDLDALNVQVQQVEAHNKNVEEDIMAVRRQAYAAEESMHDMEKGKQKQDILIDHLNKQIHSMNAEKETYKAQKLIQEKETATARETLHDANREMVKIKAEIREYLQKWKSGLIAMARRDFALKASEDALIAIGEQIRSINSEIMGYNDGINEIQQKKEELDQTTEHNKEELKKIRELIAELVDREERIKTQMATFRQSVEQTDRQLDNTQVDKARLADVVNELTRDIEKSLRQKQEIEDSIDEYLSDTTTLKHSSANILKSTKKVRMKTHSKELILGQLHNEIARVKVDVLNTEAVLKDLKENLKECEAVLKEKEQVIDGYEAEKKRRKDQIAKKQINVDRLNKKYDALMKNKGDDEKALTSPLETIIKGLVKDMENTRNDSMGLQQEWLKNQTQLVQLVNETANMNEVVEELQSRQTILSQKQLRIEAETKTKRERIRSIEKSVNGLQLEMTKLNRLIAVHKQLLEKLENDTYAEKMEFAGKLRNNEEDANMLEQKVKSLVDERNEIMESMKEMERQILLWERKIQLEIETQQALDPEYGRKEITEMKKEVHRMDVRKSQIKRKQEQIIKDVERAIAKRESIQLRNMGRSKKALTQAAVRKQINSLRSALKANIKESKNMQNQVEEKYERTQGLHHELERVRKLHAEEQMHKAAVIRKINEKYLLKQMFTSLTEIAQAEADTYQNLSLEEPVELEVISKDVEMEKQLQLLAEIDSMIVSQPQNEKTILKIMDTIFPNK